MNNYKRKTIPHGKIKFYEPVYCKGSNIDYPPIREQFDNGVKSCDIAGYKYIEYSDMNLAKIYQDFVELEDKLENHQLIELPRMFPDLRGLGWYVEWLDECGFVTHCHYCNKDQAEAHLKRLYWGCIEK